MDANTIEMGGLEDEGGAQLTAPIAEAQLLGAMMLHPGIVDDVLGMVGAVDFSDNFHRAVFECIAKGGGMVGNADLLELLGGPDAIVDGMSAKQFLGRMIGLGSDVEPSEAIELATIINECAERRAVGSASDTFLAGESFESKMGLVTWAERNESSVDAYDELVEGIIPEKELVLIIGATQAGKSFLARHLCYCLARGVPFMGHSILKPVPVVWCAYEGGRGVKARDQAYAKAHDFNGNMLLATLARPIDLWSKDLNVEELIREIEGIARTEFGRQDPGAIVIDTHNAATPGASEIDSETISKIRDRYRRLANVFKCAVIIIGHTNALGKMRGNEQLANNVETVLVVSKKMDLTVKAHPKVIIDNDKREVRSVELWKQREGATGHLFDFVLPSIETNIVSKFGKTRTSCVVRAPNWGEAQSAPEAKRNPSTRLGITINSTIDHNFFRMFWGQLQEFGEPAPPQLQLARGARVVARSIVKKAFIDSSEPDGTNKNTLESRWKRSFANLRKLDLIAYNAPADVMWWTGKQVAKIPETAPRVRYDEAPEFETMNDWPDELR